nr:Os02g0703700 [Ipomoea batatas]GMC54856.1 Os02g0703700 [Ipomoea batatas]
MTLAVVSRAAKMTPMMLSAIWSSVRLSLAPMKDPSKSLWVSPFWRRVERIWARICASSRRAFMALWNRNLVFSEYGKQCHIEVLMSRPSSDSRVAFAMVSTSGTMAFMASGMNARSTSFLSLAWLEEMSFCYQHKLRHFRARNHHATTPQYMSEENVWVLRVELEGFANVRPAQSAGWEREFDGTERDEFEDTTEEKNGEKRS